ncbi:hypothetical protein U6W65_12205, partial [Cutibacterium acnes]
LLIPQLREATAPEPEGLGARQSHIHPRPTNVAGVRWVSDSVPRPQGLLNVPLGLIRLSLTP